MRTEQYLSAVILIICLIIFIRHRIKFTLSNYDDFREYCKKEIEDEHCSNFIWTLDTTIFIIFILFIFSLIYIPIRNYL